MKRPRSLRQRILAFVGALILISLLGSTLSLYRISSVNQMLDSINQVAVPLSRLLAQMKTDAEVLQREMERGLGFSHWQDPHWKPRPLPRWISEVLDNEVTRLQSLVGQEGRWAKLEQQSQWKQWGEESKARMLSLKNLADRLYRSLNEKNYEEAAQIYPKWNMILEEWVKQMEWGARESEKLTRNAFEHAESRVTDLKTGLQMILIVVAVLSFLLLWLGERALRPLSELADLARSITLRGGIEKEDKARLPDIPINRQDEVSQLSREFHKMATALIEREKTVEFQKIRLQDQNKLLKEIGSLNENILNSIKSVLIVTDLQGVITQCNPVATQWLSVSADEVIGKDMLSFFELRQFPELVSRNEGTLKPCEFNGRIFGGRVMPLKHENGEPSGSIIVLDDLTESTELQNRLRLAENMAAVGRMSAQVAHEVRNPLHSIGLEAEMGLDALSSAQPTQVKHSLQSILAGVDRLEKITENYLKLSRLSSGQKKPIDLGVVLERVLATYASLCESQGVKVDWRREQRAVLTVNGDADLIEQALGNLLRNSIQAGATEVHFYLGNTETQKVWLKIQDNGPGIPVEIKEKLFSPFVTTRAEGTGLGLSFVKQVFEEHGGDIVYQEQSRGACFEMTL